MNAMYPVIILAGGLATRLRPLTATLPKSLVDVCGEPFIAHQLRLLQAKGIEKVFICTGYLGEQIVDYVGTGEQFGLQVEYSPDGPTLLGTAGAIKRALSLCGDLIGTHFFVLYGDSYLPCDFYAVQEAYLAQQKLGLMTVFHNEEKWDCSNVQFDNGNIIKYSKRDKNSQMHHIDYGLGVFSASAFDHIAENEVYDLAMLYQDLLAQQQLAAFEVTHRFYEAGSFAGITELEHYLISQHAALFTI